MAVSDGNRQPVGAVSTPFVEGLGGASGSEAARPDVEELMRSSTMSSTDSSSRSRAVFSRTRRRECCVTFDVAGRGKHDVKIDNRVATAVAAAAKRCLDWAI